MSQHFIFNESGSIPGIPGTFANCRVDIDDEGNVEVQPLAVAPQVESPEETLPVEIAPQEDKPVECLPPAIEAQSSEVVQEQVADAPVPFFNGGQ